jgi:putative tricarboxylic transport membrane protein
MIAQKVGVDPSKINYVACRGGGEAAAAILGGNVTVGGSGFSEFAEYINAGKMKAIAVTSAQRLPGINVPTLKEQGIDVEIGNWRGVYGAPGITPEQRKALTDMVLAALKTPTWGEALKKNDWTPGRVYPARHSRSSSTTEVREPARDDGQVRHGLTLFAPAFS